MPRDFPLLRKRTPSEYLTGPNVQIRMGAFGTGSPAYAFADVDPRSQSSLYSYHEGALFTPGTGNFVFEPNFELPLYTIWGKGFIRNPNTFPVSQPPQVYSNPNVFTNGVGGLQAGTIEFYPLNEQGD